MLLAFKTPLKREFLAFEAQVLASPFCAGVLDESRFFCEGLRHRNWPVSPLCVFHVASMHLARRSRWCGEWNLTVASFLKPCFCLNDTHLWLRYAASNSTGDQTVWATHDLPSNVRARKLFVMGASLAAWGMGFHEAGDPHV